jgi:phosphomethylpyrimidine synthase
VECGADTVMDLSTGPHGGEVLRRLLKEIKASVGTVPVYDAFSGDWKARSVADVDADEFIRSVERHCRAGVDFVTLHAGVNLDSYKRLLASPRICGVVSRGGSLTLAWMAHHEQENPLYEQFDYVLELLKEHEVTASLGDGMRPGAVADASDRPKFMEFITLGELAKRCRREGVQAMVEGPGHVPLDEIDVAVRSMKQLCDGAPLYLLGPLVTDIAPGYDHVVAAMGGAVAGMHGTDFLCMVSPAEHLGLPTIEEVREGTRVARIAAHVADTVREGVRDRARSRDEEMARKRAALDWEGQFRLSIDPGKARSRHDSDDAGDECSMCGDLCVFKLREQWLG